MAVRTFTLHRSEDVSGMSGTGVVAEGCEFTDGTAVLRWLPVENVCPTTVMHPDVANVVTLHGHAGRTQLVWDDER